MTEHTEMKTGFAHVVYVVSATKNDQSEFWACATPRRVAAAQVQRLLPSSPYPKPDASGHVVAEERGGCGVTAIGHHKRAAGAGIIVRIGERRLSAPNPVSGRSTPCLASRSFEVVWALRANSTQKVTKPVIIAPGEKVFGALLAIAGVGIILTGHWATTDDMIADLIAGLLMVAFGVVVLLIWSFQR